MSIRFEGKVAVVTGGASGIGKGIATRLRDAGATVVISDIDETSLQKTAAELGVTGIRADVTSAADVQALADEVVSRFGTADIVINNAGVGPVGPISDLSLADWKWLLDVNLWGVIHGVHSFLPILLGNPDGGHIVNTASMAGLDPNIGFGAYTASKAAVIGLTEVLAKESAQDGGKITAGILFPGPVRSNIKASLSHRPEGQDGGLIDVDAESDGFMSTLRWMDPLEVGDLVVEAISDGRPYIITHPELWPAVAERFSKIEAAFGR